MLYAFIFRGSGAKNQELFRSFVNRYNCPNKIEWNIFLQQSILEKEYSSLDNANEIFHATTKHICMHKNIKILPYFGYNYTDQQISLLQTYDSQTAYLSTCSPNSFTIMVSP